MRDSSASGPYKPSVGLCGRAEDRDHSSGGFPTQAKFGLEWATGPFVVLVTDRDYQYGPSGQDQTIVFRQSYDFIDVAMAEVDKQINLSSAEGFIRNQMGVTGMM